MYREQDLDYLWKPTKKGDRATLLEFNINKLQLEYDYDTDEDQLVAAKSMLIRENLGAIQFYAKEGDPLLLVENLKYQF